MRYLDEHGIDVVEADGRPARVRGRQRRGASVAQAAEPPPELRKKVEIDLTVEPSLDSLRLYLRSIGRVNLLTAEQEVHAGAADRAGRHARQAADDRGEPSAGRLDRQVAIWAAVSRSWI